LGPAMLSGHISARGSAGEDPTWNASRAEHGRERECRPRQLIRSELPGPVDGEHPRRGEVVAEDPAIPVPPVLLICQPVLTTLRASGKQIGHGKIQPDRQASEGRGEVKRAGRVIRIVIEPVGQVLEGLALAERGKADRYLLRARWLSVPLGRARLGRRRAESCQSGCY